MARDLRAGRRVRRAGPRAARRGSPRGQRRERRVRGRTGGAGAALPEPPPTPTPEVVAPSAPPQPDDELLGGVAAAMSLVKAYRMHGHLNARLDPLGSEPMGDPALDESRLQPPLTDELQARIPARLLRLSVPGETLLEALPRLREVYTGTIAYEIEHISDHAERVWLRQAIESGRFRGGLEADERRGLLRRLAQVEAFETYLRRCVPRPEAVLDRGPRRSRPDARRGRRARRRGWRRTKCSSESRIAVGSTC